ncbi:MAG: lysylphosphatidylglycerol synthase transmembrane domain-containing protein [Elusimicrobiota bacterium]|nr:lysylphosphatidylglycerol synthase transmembrane domain-containing protein [Elusimicrobiota bacterium]
MKTKLSIIGGLIVSAALLYFAFRNIDFSKLAEIYSRVNPLVIIPVFFVVLVEMSFRGLRWKLLLDPARPVRFWDAFRLETAGLALSNVLPLRLGEIVRGTFGAGLFGIPVVTVFATIMVERALDAIIIVILFVLAVRFGGVTGGFSSYGGYFWVLLGVLLSGLLMLVFIDEIITHRFFSGFFQKFPRLTSGLGHLALGVRAFHSFKTAAAVVALAAGQWLLDALNLYLVARAFGISDVVTGFKCIVLLFSTVVAVSIPGMPGYFGNFEFAIAKVAGSWGVNKEVAFAYATYIHLLGYIIVTVAGMVFVYQMGQSLGKVWAQFSGKAPAQET